MTWDMLHSSLDISTLHRHYLTGTLSVTDVITAVLERIRHRGKDHVWISRVTAAEMYQRARQLDNLHHTPDLFERYPLYGIPFAVKDNIDVADMYTTAACPAYAYLAQKNATVVHRLLNAGAVLIGKTNMDQFATGLVGTRSPYGIPVNPFDPAYIPGGSSSGSAVAVATGCVSFSLGTDTAGSGRVPAALNNIIGLKPTRGLLSTHGIVPACRSLDCVSIFSLTVDDATKIMAVTAGYDPDDPFSKSEADRQHPALLPVCRNFKFGVPDAASLTFFGDADSEQCFYQAIAQLQALGGEAIEIDFSPFRRTADLLYQGPWVAERYLTVGELMEKTPHELHTDVRQAIETAYRYDAADVYAGLYQLKTLQQEADLIMRTIDYLVTPTVGTTYPINDVLAQPKITNQNLGYYTNFMNLLDLCAMAIPAGMLPNGLPFGISIVALPYQENMLFSVAEAFHRTGGLSTGATQQPLPMASPKALAIKDEKYIRLCVCGAHMSGLPLNYQLLECGGRLWAKTRTAPHYKLYAMEDMQPPRPGMIRAENGVSLDIEVWELPIEKFGYFMRKVPAPLCIGTVYLETGEAVSGFLCEPLALKDSRDISLKGGWRAYLKDAC